MNKEIILITAPIRSLSGYGKKSYDIVKTIINIYEPQYDIKIIETSWGTNPNIITNDFDKYIVHNVDFDVSIYIHIGLPNEMKKIGKYNILFTSGVETTQCSPQAITGINLADLVIVPSTFTKEVFMKSAYVNKTNDSELKVNTPIEVLFEGFNQNVFKQTKSNIDLSTIKENFCYMFLGQWSDADRKNIKSLIKIFIETFKNKINAPALILKTNFGNHSKVDFYKCLETIENIKKSFKSKNLPNVYLLHGSMEDSELNELYNHHKIKCMVNLTHGEGFGRPSLEFNAIGKPILLSNFSGHLDYIKAGCCPLVEGSIELVPRNALMENVIVEGSSWFNFNENDASKKLKYIFDNYKEVLLKAVDNSNFVRKNFSLSQMEQKLKKIVDENLLEKM